MRRVLAILLALACAVSLPAADTRPRLLVMTDIGADPDDQQSLIRLMVYANEFGLEGLLATGSNLPDKPKQKSVNPALIHEIVDAYGLVRSNLLLHAPGYPSAAELTALIKSGSVERGWSAVGEGHDTEASRWIIAAASREDPRPLNISIWGGQTDLAQALWRVRQDRGDAGLRALTARLRIYDVADQDGIAERIISEFPGLFYILGNAPAGRDKRLGVFRGMYLGGDESLTSAAWVTKNIKENHGPLGALYPMKTWTQPNPHGTLKEGDTPSWFYFLPNGAGDPTHPEWGGWGGRFVREHDTVFRDAIDTVDGKTEARASVWRWRPAFQSDFAARMNWCVQPRNAGFHPPTLLVNGQPGPAPLRLTARPGTRHALDTDGSTDPDHRLLHFHWWIYPEATTSEPAPALENEAAATALLIIPKAATPGEIHLIVEAAPASPTGKPVCTTYRRIVITVNASSKK